MIKCSVYIASSADGFIAGPDGDIEWLHNPEFADAAQTGLVYSDFISDIDAIVMGRHTFEKVLTIDAWHYGNTEVIVLSSKNPDIPDTLKGKVRVLSGSPVEITDQLAGEEKKHLYIDGGNTIQRFLDAGLINEMTITVLPLLLGKGIPLFGNNAKTQPLELMDVSVADSGTVQKRYRVPAG